jgi:Ca-activated chloride channel family protein
VRQGLVMQGPGRLRVPPLVLLVALLVGAWGLRPAAQAAPAIRITAPEADTYVTGRVVLTATIDGAATVERVSFFADGRLVCAVERAPYACPWDAGAGVKEHVIRAVAQLAGGTRAVTSIRTRGVGIAEAVDVAVVQVAVLVRDGKGTFVRGLTARDFRLKEDGVAQTLTHVADEDTPLEVVMALDISASMAGAIGDVRTSARTFIGALRDRDALTVLGFNDNIFTVARRESQAEARLRALDRLAPWGGTALHDVISRGVGLLRQQAGRKGLVVFSDGEDESSRLTFDVVEKELQSSDAVMYAVGLGRGAKMAELTKRLAQLSDASGGRTVIAADTSALERAFAEVVDELSHAYVLSYSPTNDKRDGTWRTLAVEVPNRDVRLRARQGYRARTPAP